MKPVISYSEKSKTYISNHFGPFVTHEEAPNGPQILFYTSLKVALMRMQRKINVNPVETFWQNDTKICATGAHFYTPPKVAPMSFTI